MIALIQRVSQASVKIGLREVGRINCGLLVFLGVEKDDDAGRAEAMSNRLLAYRVFADEAGRMNRDVRAIGGGVLLISQFTLVADTGRGLRPSFARAASPELAEALYEHSLDCLHQRHQPVAAGIFGAHMEVSLVNDGPVTFLLSV